MMVQFLNENSEFAATISLQGESVAEAVSRQVPSAVAVYGIRPDCTQHDHAGECDDPDLLLTIRHDDFREFTYRWSSATGSIERTLTD